MPHLTHLDPHKGWRALEKTKSVENRDPIYLENKELGSGAHETSGPLHRQHALTPTSSPKSPPHALHPWKPLFLVWGIFLLFEGCLATLLPEGFEQYKVSLLEQQQ